MSGREPVLEAVVLAAGAGARFGGRKLLAPFGGGTVLAAALGAALAAPVRTVTVVVGAEPDAIGAEAERVAAVLGEAQRLQLVGAPLWRDGLAASLAAGIAALPQDADAAFIFLGDMPRVPPDIALALAAALGAESTAACPYVRGRRGHPALIRRALFPALMALSGDRGAGALLAGLGERLARVDTSDPGVLLDVDTPADLAALERA